MLLPPGVPSRVHEPESRAEEVLHPDKCAGVQMFTQKKQTVSKPLMVCQHSQAAGIKPLFSPSQMFLRVREDLQAVHSSPWQHSQSMSHWWQQSGPLKMVLLREVVLREEQALVLLPCCSLHLISCFSSKASLYMHSCH